MSETEKKAAEPTDADVQCERCGYPPSKCGHPNPDMDKAEFAAYQAIHNAAFAAYFDMTLSVDARDVSRHIWNAALHYAESRADEMIEAAEKFVIRLVNARGNCWVADWEGDPGRTTQIQSAKRFDTFADAVAEIGRLARLYPNRTFAGEPYKSALASSPATEQTAWNVIEGEADLPPSSDVVEVTYRSFHMDLLATAYAIYDPILKKWHWGDGRGMRNEVLAWMPLRKPYEPTPAADQTINSDVQSGADGRGA